MKIISVDQNKYKRNFLTIEIEPGEVCKTVPIEWASGEKNFFPVDKSGKTAELKVKKWKSTDLTGRVIKDHGTWNVGCGDGPFMGWTLGLDYEQALNLARGLCAAYESMPEVARVKHNVVSKT